MAFKLSFKLPANFKMWVWITVAAMVIGFVVGYLFVPGSSTGANTRTVNIMTGGGQAQSQGQDTPERDANSFLFIIGALILIIALVAFGYYREKQKK